MSLFSLPNVAITKPITSEELKNYLTQKFPDCKVSLKKGIFGSFILLAKSGVIGTITGINKKKQVIEFKPKIPSTALDTFFTFFPFLSVKNNERKKLTDDCIAAVQEYMRT